MVDLDFTRLCKHLQANDAETKKKVLAIIAREA